MRRTERQHWANPEKKKKKTKTQQLNGYIIYLFSIKENSHQTRKGRMLEKNWKAKTDTESMRGLGLVGESQGSRPKEHILGGHGIAKGVNTPGDP